MLLVTWSADAVSSNGLLLFLYTPPNAGFKDRNGGA